MNTLNTAGDLAGNIKLDVENAAGGVMMPMQNMMNGMMPNFGGQQQPGLQRRSTLPAEFRGLNTLDEPVCETIVRDTKILSYAIETRSC